MDDVYQDRFVVYVRDDTASHHQPEFVEQEVATCYSHEEAARVRAEFRAVGQRCIIRCVGAAGGSD